jgi:hypothetical protein
VLKIIDITNAGLFKVDLVSRNVCQQLFVFRCVAIYISKLNSILHAV